jgi:hypothetical protein
LAKAFYDTWVREFRAVENLFLQYVLSSLSGDKKVFDKDLIRQPKEEKKQKESVEIIEIAGRKIRIHPHAKQRPS